jgi:Nicotinate phosphoribosyltransferase C-terminal domain
LATNLIKPIFINGVLVYTTPNLDQIRAYSKKQISLLSTEQLNNVEIKVPVEFSEKLKSSLEKIKNKHLIAI